MNKIDGPLPRKSIIELIDVLNQQISNAVNGHCWTESVPEAVLGRFNDFAKATFCLDGPICEIVVCHGGETKQSAVDSNLVYSRMANDGADWHMSWFTYRKPFDLKSVSKCQIASWQQDKSGGKMIYGGDRFSRSEAIEFLNNCKRWLELNPTAEAGTASSTETRLAIARKYHEMTGTKSERLEKLKPDFDAAEIEHSGEKLKSILSQASSNGVQKKTTVRVTPKK